MLRYNFSDKRIAEVKAKTAMKNYLDNDKRLEFLTVSKSPQHDINLLKTYEKLLPHLLYKERFGKIEFFLSLVNEQHIHAIIKKPYVPLQKLISTWQRISGETNLMIKTIKKTDLDYNRTLDYLISQPIKHKTENVLWFSSENFGILTPQKRKPKTQSSKNKEQIPEYNKEILDNYKNQITQQNPNNYLTITSK